MLRIWNRPAYNLHKLPISKEGEHLLREMREKSEKLIRLVKLTMTNSVEKVNTEEVNTDFIKLERVVRQRDSLWTTSFHIVLEGVVCSTGIKKTITQKTTHIIVYAAELFLISTIEKIDAKGTDKRLEHQSRKNKIHDKLKIRQKQHNKNTNTWPGTVTEKKKEKSIEINERIKTENKLF